MNRKKCTECKLGTTKVIDSRLSVSDQLRRRRECFKCGSRFTTYELRIGELDMLKAGRDTTSLELSRLKDALKVIFDALNIDTGLARIEEDICTTE